MWFAGDCTRKTAEEFLLRVNKVKRFCSARFSSFTFHCLSLGLFFLLISTAIRPTMSIPILAAGWRLPHPTQLEPEPPAAVHSGRPLPAEGLQRSHPLPGGGAGLRPRKRGQKE